MTTQQTLRSYYLIAGMYTLSAALIWGVNTLFLLDAGLDIFEVFLANAAFTAGMFVFEIPTGVLADSAGRRASFLLSVTILTMTTLGYLAIARVGGGLTAFIVISVLMGLGFTFYSGAVEAWLVDALRAAEFQGDLDSVFARGSMVSGAAMLLGTLGGGALGTVRIDLPYWVRAAMLFGVFWVAWFRMHDIGFVPRNVSWRKLPSEMRSVADASIRYGWSAGGVRLLMWLGFIQFGFMSWGYYAWQPYFLELLGRDAVWVAGSVAAGLAMSAIVGNALVEWITRFCGRRTTLLLWAAGIQAAAAVGVGLADSFWVAVAFFMVVAAGMGVSGPVKQAYLHASIPSEHRASVTSFYSMAGSAGGIGLQGGLGYISRVRSIGEGYILGGGFTLISIPVLLRLRARREHVDRYVGAKAGIQGPCAAQGLPELAMIESRRTAP